MHIDESQHVSQIKYRFLTQMWDILVCFCFLWHSPLNIQNKLKCIGNYVQKTNDLPLKTVHPTIKGLKGPKLKCT